MTFSVPGYQVDQLLGRGSSAEVWSGRTDGSREAVALKRIVTTDGDVMASARAEAALLAGLDHPSLLGLRELVATEGAVVLVMELADGGSLAQLLARRDRLTPGEVASALSPVAAALAYAHDQGLQHGDVSAANVLFSASGHAKLADFGIARMIGGSADVLGTPAYLDPVIAAGGVPGPASDVFSVGAVALHCLTGSGPWHLGGAGSVEEVLAAAAAGLIPDLSARLAHCPPEMAAVVTRALDAEPYRRGTAAEFALDLRASTRPVPVMLTGGRVAQQVGRHSLESRQPAAVPQLRAPGHKTEPGLGRPVFSRPARIAAGPPPAELTHVSRPQLRQAVSAPEPRRRWLPAALASKAGWLGVGAVLIGSLAVLAITAAVVLLPRRAASVSAAGPPGARTAPMAAATPAAATSASPTSASATSAPVTPSPTRLALTAPASASSRSPEATGRTASGGPSGAIKSAGPGSSGTPGTRAAAAGAAQVTEDVATVLSRLDESRARAFAERRPGLLKQVYGVPGLLAQDLAQLAQVVPAGCRATGLHTRYRILSARQAPSPAPASRLDATVSANLAAGDLVCGGAVRGHTPAVGPVSLRLLLENEGGGYRIVSERTVF